MVLKNGATLTSDKHPGQGVHSFLSQLASAVYHIPVLERVIILGVDPDRMVHLLHSLLSVRVELYSTSRRIFACQSELLSKVLPLVLYIPHEVFVTRLSVRVVLRVDHAMHLGLISLTNWQTIPFQRSGNKAGLEYLDLDLRGLDFTPLACASWLLESE